MYVDSRFFENPPLVFMSWFNIFDKIFINVYYKIQLVGNHCSSQRRSLTPFLKGTQ